MGKGATGTDAGADLTSEINKLPSVEGSQGDMTSDRPQPLTTADQAPDGHGQGLLCGLENGRCFDGNLKVYTFDPL